MIFTPQIFKELPEITGVYLFKNNKNEILYVGKANNLKKRISSYFYNKKNQNIKISHLVKRIHNIKIIEVGGEFESLLLEAKLIKLYQPKYNTIWKDGKSYLYIKITKELFPKVLVSRKESEEEGIYFGPFPSSKLVKELLKLLRKIFPFCTQKIFLKPCFYSHLGLCQPCPSEIINKKNKIKLILIKQYQKNISKIKQILSGNINSVKTSLLKEMAIHSEKLNFEEAAKILNKIRMLENLQNKNFHLQEYLIHPDFSQKKWSDEMTELINILNNYFYINKNIEKIECYDISNIAGKFATGSMVTFIKGRPEKKFYRHFKIKQSAKINDYDMLEEIFKRRFRHSEWPLPDLLVVDGGKGQLEILRTVLKKFNINIPSIALTKRNEEIIVKTYEQFKSIRLNKRSPALQLIQRLRDEAHRFAHRYYDILRIKYLFNTTSR